jgi:hypothetical protein
VHSIIAKNNPGTTLLERSAFMRASKYNIGGVMHSLLDVRVRPVFGNITAFSVRVTGMCNWLTAISFAHTSAAFAPILCFL